MINRDDPDNGRKCPRSAAALIESGKAPIGLIATGLLLGVLAVSVPAQLRRPGSQRYLLLATERTSTMQEELNQAAGQGFRVVAGAGAGESELAYLLERVAEPFDPTHYRLLATRRLSTMERELNEAAQQGYRLLPRTVMWQDCELVLLVERTAAEDPVYQYRLLATHRTSTLQRELDQAAAAGFEVASMIRTQENVVIMERPGRGGP